MKAVIQKVINASVTSDNSVIGAINYGLVVFLAIHKNDIEANIKKMADKIINLRIFKDADGKINQSVNEVGGELLIISQFTLYGDCTRGNRPSFVKAALPEKAENYYEKFISILKEKNLKIATGKFRSYMRVSLINDGPTTIIIEI